MMRKICKKQSSSDRELYKKDLNEKEDRGCSTCKRKKYHVVHYGQDLALIAVTVIVLVLLYAIKVKRLLFMMTRIIHFQLMNKLTMKTRSLCHRKHPKLKSLGAWAQRNKSQKLIRINLLIEDPQQ